MTVPRKSYVTVVAHLPGMTVGMWCDRAFLDEQITYTRSQYPEAVITVDGEQVWPCA